MLFISPFDADCCHMGAAVKHFVRDLGLNRSFVIFDVWAL